MSGVFRFGHQAEINRAVSEHIQCMIGGLAGNIDADMRILRNKCFQIRQQTVPAECCADADGKVPKTHIANAGEFRFPCFQRMESVRYMMKKQLPFFCQRNTAGGTFEEVGLKFVFKIADGLADSRLADIKVPRCGRDRATLSDSVKNAI